MKNFIKFAFEVNKTKDEIDPEIEEQLKYDSDKQIGMFSFGDLKVGYSKEGRVTIAGEVIENTVKQAKFRLEIIKEEIRSMFGVKRLKELYILQGNKIY